MNLVGPVCQATQRGASRGLSLAWDSGRTDLGQGTPIGARDASSRLWPDYLFKPLPNIFIMAKVVLLEDDFAFSKQ